MNFRTILTINMIWAGGNNKPSVLQSNHAVRICAIVSMVVALSVNNQSLYGQELRRHALLVGCTDYKNLADFYQLSGPVNDVQLMQTLLIERFDFDPIKDDIVILAASEDAEHQPTRANIEREFLRLGQEAKSQESVVILLGGHGSQQPNNDPDNPDDQESDGLDEIFLPCDVGKWNGSTGTIENAIVDDEFRVWLGAITSREASVWLIMDACHSGSGVRGSDDEVSRQLPPEKLIPADVLAKAEASAIPLATSVAGESFFDGPGELVAIYAAQPHETTPEKKLPTEAAPDARKFYGLLTFTISDILRGTPRSLTYNELVQAVQTRYITMGRRAPTPLIEGSHRDNLVLGRESFPDRARILLQKLSGAESLAINAGALDGLTTGTILAVYPPVGSVDADPAKALGHVVITRVEMTSANVEPCEYNETSLPGLATLSDRSRCEVVFRDLGEQRLRVTIDRADVEGETVSDSIREQLLTGLRAVETNLVAIVDDCADADWLLRLSGRELLLIPATGISDQDETGLRESLAPVDLTGRWEEKAMNDLSRIARACGLLRLSKLASETSRGAGLGFQVNVLDGDGVPLLRGSAGRTLEDGQRIIVELKNTGKQSLDVTLLYVDSAYGIGCLYPQIGESNRLGGGDQQRIKLSVNATTTGIENLVSIVARGEGQPRDYSFLEQPALDRSSMRGGIDDPLARLCESALFGAGASRGMGREQAQNYEINIETWRISPKALPDASKAD